MNKKLTDKQKAALWAQQQNANFQASTRLEGYDSELVTLSPAEVAQRLQALRRHYER
ncbi:YhfG family protein [Erwinia sp. V71]|uniref:YhfG family protein n=1 Tax=Erwinia sp. V71 TaxID=3369424 RepID=UPI003F5FAAEA